MLNRRLALLAALPVVACSVALDVPSGAVIRCESQADCPDDLVCSDVLRRCVATGADSIPPALVDGSLSLVPSVATRGTTVTVSFNVSEPLGRDPDVTFVNPNLAAPLKATRSGGDGLSYTFTYQVGASEPEGLYSVVVGLVDAIGNPGAAEQPRALELDFTAPRVVATTAAVQYEPALTNPRRSVNAACADTVVRVFFAVNEALAGLPSVTAATGSASPVELDLVSSAGTFYEFERSIAGSDVSGVYTLTFEGEDRAGNRAPSVITTVPAGGAAEAPLVFTVDLESPPSPNVAVPNALTYVRRPWSATGSPIGLTTTNGALTPGALLLVYDEAGAELQRATADGNGRVDDLSIASADRPYIYVAEADDAGNLSPVVRVRDATWTATLLRKKPGQTLDNPHDFTLLPAVSERLAATHRRALTAAELAALAAQDDSAFTAQPTRLWKERNLGSLPNSALLPAYYGYDTLRQRPFQILPSFTGAARMPIFVWEGEWRQLEQTNAHPGNVIFGAFAFDETRAVGVLFGGVQIAGTITSLDGLWEWDGERWEQRASGPPTRARSAMAYDPVAGYTLLFGGVDLTPSGGLCSSGDPDTSGCVYGDTWAWDGASWTALATSGPAPRLTHAMAYDPSRDGVILYGGCLDAACTNLTSDVWRWDRTSRVWESLKATTAPLARKGARLVFDDADSDLLMIGGDNPACPANEHCAGLFRLDQSDDFVPASESGLVPTARANTIAVYDRNLEHLLVHGGNVDGDAGFCVGGGALCNPTYIWAGGVWTVASARDNRITPPEQPDARMDLAGVYDAPEGLLLVGGRPRVGINYQPPVDDTWAWDGTGWKRRCDNLPAGDVCTATQPVYNHALAYDSARDVTVRHGGESNASCAADASLTCDQTYEWSGSNWALTCGRNASPACSAPKRAGPAMAYDPDHTRVVMFGGSDQTIGLCPTGQSSTYEYGAFGAGVCGTATRCWRQVSTTISPPARTQASMVYDPHHHVVLLYGGRHCTASACPAGSTQIGTSGANNVCLYQDFWKLDGSTWTALTPTASPPGRYDAMFTYDTTRGRALLFGGGVGLGQLQDLWEWDGEVWTELTDGDYPGPEARDRAAFAYLPTRSQAVLALGDGEVKDLWEVDLSPNLAPGGVFTVAWRSAEVPDATVRALHVRANAAGRGYAIDLNPSDGERLAGAPIDGVEIRGWNRRAQTWQLLASGSFGTTPGALSYDSADAAAAGDLVEPVNAEIHVLVRPTAGGGNGPAPARAVIDYVEATVDYRLP